MQQPRRPNKSRFDNAEDYGEALDEYDQRQEDYELWCDREYDRLKDEKCMEELDA